MPINYVPNDPLVTEVPMRRQKPRPDRPANRAGLNFFDAVAEQLYDRDAQPLEFLFWQCREAVLAALDMWEAMDGNLAKWAHAPKIDLSQNFQHPQFTGTRRLNAFYDGSGLRFFIFDDATPNVFSGISADTVSHETGHALLDVMRPEFFTSIRPEINAFHEAFGDCTAILTALADKPTRKALLTASPNLDTPNFVEASSEYLSEGIRQQFGNVAPSLPRRGLNDFNWQLPTTLPPGAFNDAPELLSVEAHSFSRVFTGCFYDNIRFIFARLEPKNEANLLKAAQTAGRLLVAAVRATPETSRYFRAVGRAMVLADQQTNAGANRDAIRDAFSRHNLALGSAAMLAPTTALAGETPTVLKSKAALAPATLRDLRSRIKAPAGTRLSINPKNMFGQKIAEVVHQREVPLGDVDKSLRGVVAFAAESVLVGSSGKRAAVLDALPEPTDTVDEVQAYVRSLLENGRIQLEKKTRGVSALASTQAPEAPTHVIRPRAGKKVLERVRFLCTC